MLSIIAAIVKVCTILGVTGYVYGRLLRPEDRRWIAGKPLWIMTGFFAVGMLSPSVWLLYALEIIVIAGLSRNWGEAASLYMVTCLALPNIAKELGVGSIYLLLCDKWMFAAIGLGLALLIRPRSDRATGWLDLPFWLFFALEIVQARDLNVTSTMRSVLGTSLTMALPFFALSRSLARTEDIRRLLLTWSFCAACLSAVAVFEARTGWLVYDQINQHLGASATVNYGHTRGGLQRAAGSFPEATGFGIFLASGLIATVASRSAFRRQRNWFMALGLIVIGLLAANARAGLLAAVIGIPAYDLYRRRYGLALTKIGLIAGVATIVLMAAQVIPSVGDRFGLNESGGTVDYRKQLWRRGLEEIASHPLIGRPPGEAVASLMDMKQGEGIIDIVNGYVFYGLTAGIPGMLAVLASFGTAAQTLLSRRRRLAAEPGLLELAAVPFAIALATAVITWTSGIGIRTAGYFIPYLALCAALCARSRSASAGRLSRAGMARPPMIVPAGLPK